MDSTGGSRAEPAEVPPRLALFQMITGHYVSRAIWVAAKLGIADLLADGPRPGAQLAASAGVHAPSLHRVMRLLASVGVFAENENGGFALTPIGEWLQSGPGSSSPVALLFAEPNIMRAWGDLLYSVETGNTAFDHVFGMDVFAYLAAHPEEAAVFNRAMTAVTAPVAGMAAAAYDFSQFTHIVDVGGGQGALLTAILKSNPALRGTLFDLPHVTESARPLLAAAGLAARCEISSGDFFHAVPAGADAYIVKHVIHDWDDERSTAILKNCRRAMAPQGKLLLVETVLPERIAPSPMNFIATGSDVNMLVNAGGRERTETEFRALVDAAGFRLTRIVPTQSLSSVIEATPLG
jgi:hypothetical protein